MSWKPPSADARFENWTVEEDHELLGTVTDEESPALYDAEADRVFRGQVDPDAEHLAPDTAAAIDEAEESLGEFLDRVGEETGWDSLSEFAREHLEDEQGSRGGHECDALTGQCETSRDGIRVSGAAAAFDAAAQLFASF